MRFLIAIYLILLISSSVYATYTPSAPNMLATYENGAFEDFSTANVWYKNMNWDEAIIFTNFSADLTNGDFYYTGNRTADYYVQVNSSLRAPTGALFSQGIFRNNTVIDSFSREMTKGPNRLAAFLGISSDGSDAAFDTNSSLSYLMAADGDDVIIQEGTGGTGCFFLKVRYNNIDVPNDVVISTSAYISNNSNHWINVKMLNYSTDTHTELNEATKDWEDVGATLEPYERVTWSFAVPTPRLEYVESGTSEIVIYHNDPSGSCADTHRFNLDETHIIDRLNSIPFPSFHKVTLSKGDKISVRHKSDLADSDVILNHVEIFIMEINI